MGVIDCNHTSMLTSSQCCCAYPSQAEKLYMAQKLQVAFNLGLREEVLIEKCLGRCSVELDD